MKANLQTVKVLTHIHGIPIYRNFVENLPYNFLLKKIATDNRKAGVLSEVLFWKEVRAGVFFQIDFDRQRVIGDYIVDFYVKALGLAVEIEKKKSGSPSYENASNEYLQSLGLKVFRMSEEDVKYNLPLVMQSLANFIIQNFGNHPVKN